MDAVPPLLNWRGFDDGVFVLHYVLWSRRGRVIACLEAFRFADPRWHHLLSLCTVGRSPVTRKVLAEAQFDEFGAEILQECPGRDWPPPRL